MPFDPDKFLKDTSTKAPKGFDPDAFLASTGTPKETGSVVDQIPTGGDFSPPKPTKKPTTALQNLAGDIAEYGGPVIEALGALGGGVLGAGTTLPTGPGAIAGGAAGAGIGYSAARQSLNMLNEYAGRQAPPTVTNALTRPVTDALEGAVMELAGGQIAKLLGTAFSKIAGKAVDIGDLSKQRAAKIARESVGGKDEVNALASILRNADPSITAGQAAAGTMNPTFQALSEQTLKRDPKFVGRLAEEQMNQSMNKLARIANASDQTAATTVQQAERKALSEALEPTKQMVLTRANMGKDVARFEGQVAPEANEAVAKTLRDRGIKPITLDKIIPNINKTLTDPTLAANPEVEKSMPLLKKTLLEWQERNGGVIDASAVDSIRKNLVNKILDQTPNSTDPNVIKRVNAMVVSKVKPMLVDAIEEAGGTGYRGYLKAYEKGAQAISQKKMGAEALEMFQKNPKEFVRLVEGNSPDAVEKVFGPGSYDIAKEMAADSMISLKGVAATVKRGDVMAEQSQLGRDALREVFQSNSGKFRFPSLLSAKVTATNAVLDRLQDKIGNKTMNILTESMKSGKSAAELLETLPASERVRILNLMKDPKNYMKPGTSAAIGANMLSNNEETPVNTLAR
jgi:hypothetical protein